MKCTDYEILINDFADGTILPAENNILQEHVRTCANCSKILQQTLQLQDKTAALPREIAPSGDLWKGIEEKLSDKKVEFTQITGNYFSFQSQNNNGASEKIKALPPAPPSSRYLKYGIAAVVAIICFAVSLPFILNLNRDNQNVSSLDAVYWQISKVKGSPKSTDKTISSADSVAVGDWVITDDTSQAILKIANIGSITINPSTKVKVVKSVDGEHRILLEYGTIDADITAGARKFYVDTKSATAVDLGCAYTYSVGPQGDGIIFVKSGMVQLESNGRESLVPAGKYCITKTGIGPGTPYREDSSPEFRKALLTYDFKNGGTEALNIILRTASKTDAATLLNLIPRVDENQRSLVYKKIAAFVPPPRPIAADSIPNLYKLDELNEWMGKIQDEMNKEMEINMQKLNETIKKQVESSTKLNQLGPEFQQELQEKISDYIEKNQEILEKNLEKMHLKGDIIEQQINKANEQLKNKTWKDNTDWDKFNKDMQKFGEEMQKFGEAFRDADWSEQSDKQQEATEREQERQQREIERQQEQIEREQERQQREIERQQEQIQRDQEKQQREIERQQEQIERDQERKQEQLERDQERKQEQFEREQERRQEELERKMEKIREKMEDDDNSGGDND